MYIFTFETEDQEGYCIISISEVYAVCSKVVPLMVTV